MSERDLTERTPRMVGRQEETERLKEHLHARGERHFLYYWAYGGLGKTRLLEELLHLVTEAGEGFYSAGIIDLYHTDTHSTSDVERAIVNGLDPDHRYFRRYREERKRYELLRERGTDPGVLERRREMLGKLFVEGCHEMALDARKLVLCFDTVELLQYESSIVEERGKLDTSDTRIKPWLLDKLSQLKNVLVVFAGRPQEPGPGEIHSSPQARLVTDLQAAFGDDLTIIELKPFTLDETRSFVETLSGEELVIPEQYIEIVHRLTGGRPIFLHLIVDLVRVLSPEPRQVLEMFDRYTELVNAPEEDERLKKAREQIEREILRGVFNVAADLGGILARIALMPKGVDEEILHQALGLPRDEARQSLDRLTGLSFIKKYIPLPGAERLHGERVFLHDEMYRLMTIPGVIPNLRLDERTVAHGLVLNYYTPRIRELEQAIDRHGTVPQERIPLRERLQKLRVERLYYLLVEDPRQGYKEYQRLSDQANRHRWVGYSMRLLDEFLRFYNRPERRKLFRDRGIEDEQIVRESAQMWVERFHWWGQYRRSIHLAEQILAHPELFSIRLQETEDMAIMGNIRALWARAKALLSGYDPEAVQEAERMWERLPSGEGEGVALARARLATSIGYLYRLGGMLSEASYWYVRAQADFRALGAYRDELAQVLNNLAFAYARQGRVDLARPLAHEALRIDEELGNEYSTGLTLSTLSSIARMRGHYAQAIKYAEEALELFRQLEDAHGVVLAHLGLAEAQRRMAKHEIEKNRKLEEARGTLEKIATDLEDALETARRAGLEDANRRLKAEQGRLHRDLGHAMRVLKETRKSTAYYTSSARLLREALNLDGWNPIEKADAQQDLAETLFFSGDEQGARESLEQIGELLDVDISALSEESISQIPNEYFLPLAKAEMTWGQMAFMRGEKGEKEGLQRFLQAYVYFTLFSPDAVEKDRLLEYLYKRMRNLSVARQRALVETVRDQGFQKQIQDKFGVNVESFVRDLGDLLGVF